MDCPFCKSNIEDSLFAKSQHFMAAYNIAPILPGHILILPKKHIESLFQLAEKDLSELIIFTRNVTALLLEVFHAESFNWSIQEKEAAGQTIAHLHWHVVPRYMGDLPEPGDWYPKIENNYEVVLDSFSRKKLSQDSLLSITRELRKRAEIAGLWEKH